MMPPTQGQAFIRHHAHTRHFETPNGASAWRAILSDAYRHFFQPILFALYGLPH